jgi:hypothetical protein
MKNWTVVFLCLFSASIAGGMALNPIIDYAMLAGTGLGIIFLLTAAFFQGGKMQMQAEMEGKQ